MKAAIDINQEVGFASRKEELLKSKFYAERNMYLIGMGLFVSFAINRYMHLLNQLNTSETKVK